jgi:hypothetical protein
MKSVVLGSVTNTLFVPYARMFRRIIPHGAKGVKRKTVITP